MDKNDQKAILWMFTLTNPLTYSLALLGGIIFLTILMVAALVLGMAIVGMVGYLVGKLAWEEMFPGRPARLERLALVPESAPEVPLEEGPSYPLAIGHQPAPVQVPFEVFLPAPAMMVAQALPADRGAVAPKQAKARTKTRVAKTKAAPRKGTRAHLEGLSSEDLLAYAREKKLVGVTARWGRETIIKKLLAR